jgi:hypothetical protein
MSPKGLTKTKNQLALKIKTTNPKIQIDNHMETQLMKLNEAFY